MINFKQYLLELMQPVDVNYADKTVDTHNFKVFEFKVKDHEFKVMFNRSSNLEGTEWEWEFEAIGEKNVYGLGSGYGMQHWKDESQYKVLSTAFSYMIAFLEHEHPKSLSFQGSKKDAARIPVYKRIMQRFKPIFDKMGYDYSTQDEDNTLLFVLTRNTQ